MPILNSREVMLFSVYNENRHDLRLCYAYSLTALEPLIYYSYLLGILTIGFYIAGLQQSLKISLIFSEMGLGLSDNLTTYV